MMAKALSGSSARVGMMRVLGLEKTKVRVAVGAKRVAICGVAVVAFELRRCRRVRDGATPL